MIRGDLKYLLQVAHPYRHALLANAILSVAASALLLAVPWLAGSFAGKVAADQVMAAQPVLLGIIALLAGQALLRFGHNWLTMRTGEHIYADLRQRVYDHLQSLSMPFFEARSQGEVLSLLMVDVATLGRFLSGTLVGAAPMVLTLTGALVMMFALAPGLALLAMLVAPVFILLIRLLARPVRPLSLLVRDEETAAHAIAEDNFSMLETVKAFTREAAESSRYAKQIDTSLAARARRRWITAALGPAVQFAAAAAIVAVLWLAAPMLNTGTLSTQDLVSFLLYAVLLTRPLTALAGLYGKIQVTLGALARLLEALNEAPETLGETGTAIEIGAGAIEFHDVGFAYPDGATVFSNLNLRIQPGETVAITGPNGGGKTTLIKLLLRFHDVTSGAIFIDGTDIAEVTRASLRAGIGLVPQRVVLFDGSIADNIAYGRDGASDADIEAAARTGCAHEFVTALPDGYATRVGSRGMRLSGGQRQRIALARALLRDPAILILDEGTAMLDAEGEAAFLDQAHEAFAGRTVILVTHQMATLEHADRVVRLESGQVQPVEPALKAIPTGRPG